MKEKTNNLWAWCLTCWQCFQGHPFPIFATLKPDIAGSICHPVPPARKWQERCTGKMRSINGGSIAVLNYCLFCGEQRFAFGMSDSKSSISFFYRWSEELCMEERTSQLELESIESFKSAYWKWGLKITSSFIYSLLFGCCFCLVNSTK